MPLIHFLLLLWHGAVNVAGMIMFAIGFGVAALAQNVFGELPEGVLMMVAGPIMIALDLLYRARRPERNWWHFRSGGSLLFLPAWQLGTVWFMLGVCYVIRTGLK
jgi:hypothetical protein